MRFHFSGFSLGLVCVMSMYASSLFAGPVTTDSWDEHQGGAIVSSSPTIGGFDPIAIIGGPNGGGESGNGSVTDDTIFQNGNPFPDVVQFTRTQTTSLSGTILYNSSDNHQVGGDRQTTNFELLASSHNNGVYDVTLVPETAVTNEDGSGTTFMFTAPTTLTSFEAEFWGNPSGNNGPRIIELDSINTTPEPSSIVALCGLGGMGLVVAIRRRRAKLQK